MTLVPAISLFLTLGTFEISRANPKPVSLNQDFPTMQKFIKALNTYGITCNSYAKKTGVLIVTEEGTCKTSTTEITLDIFPTDKLMNQVLSGEASMMQAFQASYASKKNWSIIVFSKIAANNLSKVLGIKFIS